MQLARTMKRNPRELAQLLLLEIPRSPLVEKIEVAGAGFINFHLDRSAKLEAVRAVLEQGRDFGRLTLGGKRKVQIEFVSANPTGPLHVGHGRGAAYGASLAKLLGYAGWDVTSEYYVNDAGRQMDILAAWASWLAQRASRKRHGAIQPSGESLGKEQVWTWFLIKIAFVWVSSPMFPLQIAIAPHKRISSIL
jgi:arginyl-tRNA synthetase